MKSRIENKLNRYLMSLVASIESFLLNCDSSITTNSGFVVQQRQGGEYVANLKDPIIMTNVPYRSDGKKKQRKLHIFITGRFTIKVTNGKYILDSYGTHVSYCRDDISSIDLIPMDAFHFDMDASKTLSHPVFHVQRKPKIISKDVNVTSFSVSDDEVSKIKCLQNMRIATPQFDLFSLLPMILADHLLLNDDKDHCNLFEKIISKTVESSPIKVDFSTRENISQCFVENSLHMGRWYQASQDTA